MAPNAASRNGAVRSGFGIQLHRSTVMASFAYVATDKTGKEVKGNQDASNKDALIKALRGKGLMVKSVQEEKAIAKAKQKSGGFRLFGGKVALKDLSIFCRQFATMINAGVSLVRCLDVLEMQTTSVRLKEIIRDIEQEVQGGATLSRSMNKFPKVFTNLTVGLVRAGEVGGVLDETLERLAGFLENDMALRRKVKSAMTYPVLVMIMAVGIVTFLVTFILPKFIQMFKDLGMTDDKFPMPTLILMKVSNFATSKWYIVIIIIVASSIAINRVKATKTGKRYMDIFKLKAPVFGKLNHMIAIARFARANAALLSAGVPLLESLKVVRGLLGNEVMASIVDMTIESVTRGQSLARTLAQSPYFPPAVTHLLGVGERTGRLSEMFERVAKTFERQTRGQIKVLLELLAPMMIVLLAVMVGMIALSILLPIMRINQLMK
jgi:type IV pilus assembly protein PilC